MADMQATEREALLARIAALESNQKPVGSGLKTYDKGGVGFYGNGRLPVTQYATRWIRIIQSVDEIKAHLVKDFAKLSFRTEAQRAAAAEFLGVTL